MAFKKTPSYLWQKDTGLWHFKMGIPPVLRKHYADPQTGKEKTHVVISLRTHNRAEAMKLKDPLVVATRADFKRFSDGLSPAPSAYLGEMIEGIRGERRRLQIAGEVSEGFEIALGEEAERIVKAVQTSHGDASASFAAHRMAYPDKVSLTEALGKFVAASENKAQTIESYKLAVRDLLAFLKVPDCFPEDVTEEKAVEYVDHLNSGSLSKSVKSKRLGGLHQVWLHMRRRGWPQHSPWSDHKLTTPGKVKRNSEKPAAASDEENEDVRPFTTDEATRIFTLPAPKDKRQRTYTRELFRELYVLGFTTGMRLNEIVSLRRKDVEVEDKTWRMVSVPKAVAKKAASIRQLPVCHPVAVAVLDARIARAEGLTDRLFPECAEGGPDAKPSWHVSKAMSIERLSPKRLAFTSEVNFHSTRRSFASLLEQASKGEPFAQQRYLGHSIPTIMHTVYSKRSGMPKLKAVVQGIKYPDAIERALRMTTGTE